MAAVLELLLQERVRADAVLSWLTVTAQESSSDAGLAAFNFLRKDFVPFLLNFLREQTSQILSNGPSTPAKTLNSKTPSKPVSLSSHQSIPEKRSNPSPGHRGSRVQLFAQSPNSISDSFASPNSATSDSSFMSRSNLTNSSGRVNQTSPNSSFSPTSHNEKRSAQKPNLGNFLITSEGQTPRRGRKKGSSSNRHANKDGSRRSTENEFQGESSTWSASKNQICLNANGPPSAPILNLNNLEEFPPMGATCESISNSKPSRRINPTPLSDVHSKSRICFTSTPVSASSLSRNHTGMEAFLRVQEGVCTPDAGSLREEREILRKERSKMLHQTSTPMALDPITPTKQGFCRSTSIATDMVTNADPDKVTCRKQLEVLAELYSACMTENLVPNIMLEIFFIFQLLTSRGPVSIEDRNSDVEIVKGLKDAVERQHFQSVHNCVFFAVLVLDLQFIVISHLDKSTLKLLAENERIGIFSPTLQERLVEAHRTSTGKVSLLFPSTLHSVSFQPETDNRSNFPSDRSFHIFKKQRDIFYELLREWEDCHEKTEWDFERGLGNKIRTMMYNLSLASDHSHFARLFQKQLVQLCKGPSGGVGSSDNPDQDLLNMLGPDNLSRLKRLQERFVAPQSVGGPCPPPSFPGYQEFFRDFILTAGNYQFNQHLVDSLCQEIKELNVISIVVHETTDGESDMNEQDEKIRFASVLLTLRLLAKFLGFVTFLPYRTTEIFTSDLQESAVALRNQTVPVLDVYLLLRHSMQSKRTILTVPWIVEYLSLVDGVAPYLEYYRRVFYLLLHLYRYKLILTNEKEMGLLNKLLLLAVLGWLFQLPTVPEEMFFNYEPVKNETKVDAMVTGQALDCVTLVDQHLMYNCCPYIGELRKLLISFVTGSASKNGGFIRKITPTAAEPLMPKPTLTQKKLQAELEQAFFHNQPPSLRRSVEFVAERIGSNCVKHIKATLVADLVKKAEVILQDKVSEDSTSQGKILDNICDKLCEEGRQALQKGQEYCKRKAPEAVRVLLPEETSACVLRSAEDIAVTLAIDKACTWLSANISALIKREVKATFNRMVKSQNLTSSFVDSEDIRHCSDACEHKVTLPSTLITEIKEFLCIGFGPRDEHEGLEFTALNSFLERLSRSLSCRKYITPSAELHLAKCTVELASLLVSNRVPLVQVSTESNASTDQYQTAAVKKLLASLLTMWKKDFGVNVPIHLFFSHKNMMHMKNNKTQECWELFVFTLQQIFDSELVKRGEIEEHIYRLQKWPLDLLPELDRLVLGPEKLKEPSELKDSTCIYVPPTEIIAPS